MATINSVEYALAVPSAPPSASNRPNKQHGRIRLATATFVSDGTLVNGTTGTATDTFNLFVIPAGARIVDFRIGYSGTPNTNQLSIGITGAVAAYRAAALITAGSQVPTIPATAYASSTLGVGNSELASATLVIMTSSVAVMASGTLIVTCGYVVD